MKKTWRVLLIAYAVMGLGICVAVVNISHASEKVIHLTAKKFEFAPAEIIVKKGEPVAIEIKSDDVKHGFILADFGVRTDIKPGQTNVVHFTPDKAGQFTFTCDVFCGSGHEEMSGTLTVTE